MPRDDEHIHHKNPHAAGAANQASIRREDYDVRRVSREDCRWYVEELHYAHRWPPIQYAYGLYRKCELVGICSFGTPAAAQARRTFGDDQRDMVIELNRLVLRDNLHNEASMLIRAALRLLQRDHGACLLVTYADTSVGHHGGVYQASGLTYIGTGPKRSDRVLKSRPDLHAQSLTDYGKKLALPGERPIDALERVHPGELIPKPRPVKHRYVEPVPDPGLSRREQARWRSQAPSDWLIYPARPYAKPDVKNGEDFMTLKDRNGKKTAKAGDELVAMSADRQDAATESSSEEDPFAIENLTVDGTNMEDLGIERPLLAVPVQKPNKQDFFRVHPDPSFSIVARVLELQAERETYLVTRAVWPMLPGETKLVKLVTYQSRQGGLALWPLKLVEEGNRETLWHKTARKASEIALTKWIRMQANMSTASYDVVTSANIPDPVWPETTMSELLRVAFQDGKLITNTEHPVVRQLMGE